MALHQTDGIDSLRLPVSRPVFERGGKLLSHLNSPQTAYIKNDHINGSAGAFARQLAGLKVTSGRDGLLEWAMKQNGRRIQGGNMVMAIGARALRPGILLARHQKRELVWSENIHQAINRLLRLRPSSALLVLPPAGRSAIEILLAAVLPIPLGLVFGETQEELEWNAAKTIIYGRFVAAGETDVILKPSFSDPEIILEKYTLMISGSQSSANLRTVLSAPKRILALLSHSDGASTFLGQATLCARVSNFDLDTKKSVGAPTCFNEDYCPRFNIPLAEAQKRGVLIPPESVTADVFLNYVCWGVHLGGILDTHFTLGTKLIASELIRSFVATVGAVTVGSTTIYRSLTMLKAGWTLGSTILQLNEEAGKKAGSFQFVLFGDPLYRPFPPARKTTAAVNEKRGIIRLGLPVSPKGAYRAGLNKTPSTKIKFAEIHMENKSDEKSTLLPVGGIFQGRSNELIVETSSLSNHRFSILIDEKTEISAILNKLEHVIVGLEFLHTYLDTVSTRKLQNDLEGVEEMIRRVRETLLSAYKTKNSLEQLALENIIWPQLSRQTWSSFAPLLSRTSYQVIGFLQHQAAAIGSIIIHDWGTALSPSETTAQEIKCWNCGRKARRHKWKKPLTDMTRFYSSCTGCGIIYDGPEKNSASIKNNLTSLRRGVTYRFDIQTKDAEVLLGAVIECSNRKHSLILPIEPGERFIKKGYKLPKDFPPGICVRSIFSMADGHLAIWRGPTRVA